MDALADLLVGARSLLTIASVISRGSFLIDELSSVKEDLLKSFSAIAFKYFYVNYVLKLFISHG